VRQHVPEIINVHEGARQEGDQRAEQALESQVHKRCLRGGESELRGRLLQIHTVSSLYRV
jgi:hypothetical protein